MIFSEADDSFSRPLSFSANSGQPICGGVKCRGRRRAGDRQDTRDVLRADLHHYYRSVVFPTSRLACLVLVLSRPASGANGANGANAKRTLNEIFGSHFAFSRQLQSPATSTGAAGGHDVCKRRHDKCWPPIGQVKAKNGEEKKKKKKKSNRGRSNQFKRCLFPSARHIRTAADRRWDVLAQVKVGLGFSGLGEGANKRTAPPRTIVARNGGGPTWGRTEVRPCAFMPFSVSRPRAVVRRFHFVESLGIGREQAFGLVLASCLSLPLPSTSLRSGSSSGSPCPSGEQCALRGSGLALPSAFHPVPRPVARHFLLVEHTSCPPLLATTPADERNLLLRRRGEKRPGRGSYSRSNAKSTPEIMTRNGPRQFLPPAGLRRVKFTSLGSDRALAERPGSQ